MTSDLKKMYSNFCRRVLKVVGKIGPSADAADALKRFSSAVNNPIFHFSEKRSRNISRCPPPPNRDMETRCPPGGDTGGGGYARGLQYCNFSILNCNIYSQS